MDSEEQLCILCESEGIAPIKDRLEEEERYPIKAESPRILQINVCRKCNLHCRHCHVHASPKRSELMSRENLEKCLEIARKSETIDTIDVTGGAPELSPHLKWFIKEASKLGKRLIVRSNLAILTEDEYSSYIDFYAKHGVELVGSLPDHGREKTDRMRGAGTYDKVIDAIKSLNKRGYGTDNNGLILDLVHNPVGALMPGSQNTLESECKHRLKEEHGILFNTLYTITNMPLGRYLTYLLESGNYIDYMNELVTAFNPSAADNAMCKTTVSVSWDGRLYDCDFNQMLDLPIDCKSKTLKEWDSSELQGREIVLANHCYGCTAGAGSSCQGATAK
jgi:radical SAM/Cys-rich protein